MQMVDSAFSFNLNYVLQIARDFTMRRMILMGLDVSVNGLINTIKNLPRLFVQQCNKEQPWIR